MIKKASFRRILTASFALFLVILSIYIFPKDDVKIPSKTIYKKAETSAIYLIDKNNYVARTKINVESKDKEKLARELISALTIGTNKNKYLPEGFKAIIPKNVEVKDIRIEDDLIIIDFNSNIFSSNKISDEKIIESLVYSLTEISGINKVKILINGNLLNRLPSSNKIIPEILTRDIGINHMTKINSIKNTKDVTTYFINNYNNENYYIPVTLTTDDEDEKISIIIKELESRDNIDHNLSTYLQAGTTLKNYQILENEINMEFNNVIFNSLNDIDEEVVYGLALSIKDNYNIDKISIDVDNKQIKTYALKNS